MLGRHDPSRTRTDDPKPFPTYVRYKPDLRPVQDTIPDHPWPEQLRPHAPVSVAWSRFMGGLDLEALGHDQGGLTALISGMATVAAKAILSESDALSRLRVNEISMTRTGRSIEGGMDSKGCILLIKPSLLDANPLRWWQARIMVDAQGPRQTLASMSMSPRSSTWDDPDVGGGSWIEARKTEPGGSTHEAQVTLRVIRDDVLVPLRILGEVLAERGRGTGLLNHANQISTAGCPFSRLWSAGGWAVREDGGRIGSTCDDLLKTWSDGLRHA